MPPIDPQTASSRSGTVLLAAALLALGLSAPGGTVPGVWAPGVWAPGVWVPGVWAARTPAAANPAADQPADDEQDELPLASSDTLRWLRFTTDEATWLSVDLSPDGQTLVLEVLGDLYTLPIAGGKASPLSVSLAFESQPAFSPDGESIAFLSDRDGAENLWIAKRDGSEPKKLSAESATDFASPSWTPDGQYVLVSRTVKGFGTYESLAAFEVASRWTWAHAAGAIVQRLVEIGA
jgi:hypothetical protein